MAGVKGRSGRRVKTDEQLRKDTIQKAWLLTNERLNSQDIKRHDTAEALCLKDMVNKQSIDARQDIKVRTEEQSALIDGLIAERRQAN